MVLRFHVVIPSYNNREWVERNLGSVLGQDWGDYCVTYVDDASEDGTAEEAERLIQGRSGARLQRNAVRKGTMANFYEVIHGLDPDEVVVVVDGDDWLAHSSVLKTLFQ